jgi:glycosyltransferase involved in cell wall biosynthesis
MAAKNYARFLPAAVESVFSQTVSNWELIIIDDGSIDDTHRVVQQYLNDRRVKYVRSDRLGQSRAKNLGVGLTRGEFVAFLDADDMWEPTKLEKQLAEFESDVGVVYSLRSIIDEAGREVSCRVGPRPTVGSGAVKKSVGRGPTLQESIDTFYVHNPICFSSVVVRRTLLEQVGGFDPGLDLAIDYDLWLRAARVTRFLCVPEELVRYRTGHGNLSKKLSDRVATAFSIMHRAERQGGVSPAAVAEGRATTARTLAYVIRDAEPGEAVRWNLKALMQHHRRRESLKGLLAATVKWIRRKPTAGSAENLLLNR